MGPNEFLRSPFAPLLRVDVLRVATGAYMIVVIYICRSFSKSLVFREILPGDRTRSESRQERNIES